MCIRDRGADAYEKLVNQLLASEHYGEHQARYWLDAVRYGDTHGLHLDNKRGIYPYRDWVVYAFNSNLRLDKFITWQLAGDLLPRPTLQQRVATGFVRMNPTTAEGGAIPLEFQAKNNFDRTETLGTVLLGMTLTCARCHTHKYDPIPQTEYYQLLAFFNSTAENSMDGNSYTYAPVIKAPANQQAWMVWNNLNADGKKLLAGLKKETAAALEAKDANKWKNGSLKDRLLLLASAADAPEKDEAKKIADAMGKSSGSFTTTLVAKDLGKPRVTRVLSRGEYNLPIGDPLQPGTLSIMGAFPEKAPRNRLGLARWLTSPDHPLTARVTVNRYWQMFFGYGLVRTPEDFGSQGESPSHPDLLDWLSLRFIDSGWDIRELIRTMVTSATYRQDSRCSSELFEKDPENSLLARGPRYRLPAEMIRDNALATSGLLIRKVGGAPVRPYEVTVSFKPLKRDKGEGLYRRSVYTFWKRTAPAPVMMSLDASKREVCAVRRERTASPLQALVLMNDPQLVEAARILGQRLLKKHAGNSAVMLDEMFRVLTGRHPDVNEYKILARLYREQLDFFQANPGQAANFLKPGDSPPDKKLSQASLAATGAVANVLLNFDEAVMKR